MKNCCVKNCHNNSAVSTKVNENLPYFRFPKNAVLRRQWKKIVDLNTKIISTTLVCCDHFEPKYIYMRGGSPNLHPDTIPTIFAGSEFKIEPEKSVSSSLLSVEVKIEPENSTSLLLLSDEVKIEPENSTSLSLLSDEVKIEPENSTSLSLLSDEVKIEPEKLTSLSLLSVEIKIEPENSTSLSLLSDEVKIEPENLTSLSLLSDEVKIEPENSTSLSLLSDEVKIEPENLTSLSLLSDEVKIEPENSTSLSLLSDEVKIEPEKLTSLSLLSDEVKIEPENSTSLSLLSDEVHIKRENSMSSLSPEEDNHEPITKKSKLDLPVMVFIPLPTSQDSNITANITALPKLDVDEINDETPLSLDLLREIPKKITIKKALNSSTFEGNLSWRQTLTRAKSKLEILRVAYDNLQMKATNLPQILRRRNKRIAQMENCLKNEKNKNLIDEEQLINLLGMSSPIRELLKRQLRKVKGKRVSKLYPKETRVFAMNLYHYSPKAYEYVRTVFHSLLPNMKTLAEWKKGVNASSGITEESFDTISDGFIEESFDTNNDEFTEEFLIE